MTVQAGIVIRDSGAAVVSCEMDAAGAAVVVGIDPLPFNFDAVAERVRELDAEVPRDGLLVVDAEGLGRALWASIAPPRKSRRWRLYEGRGAERQELADRLVVAMHDSRIHFAAGLDAMDLMTRALVGYRRQVREDGLVGSELVVALCLAITPRPPRKSIAFLA